MRFLKPNDSIPQIPSRCNPSAQCIVWDCSQMLPGYFVQPYRNEKSLHSTGTKSHFHCLPSEGGFYKTDNTGRRRFIKCLHFKRDKIAFSLPSKWEKNFFENWVPFFALFAIVVLWGTFLRKAGAAKKWKANEKKGGSLLQCIYEGVIKKFKFIWAFSVFRVLV